MFGQDYAVSDLTACSICENAYSTNSFFPDHTKDEHGKHEPTIPQYDGLEFSFCISDSDISSDPNCSTTSEPALENSWFSQPDSSIPLEDSCPPQPIPVHISPRPQHYPQIIKIDKKHRNNITVKRDNRLVEALSLPIFTVYNMRSIWSKLSSLAEDMEERDTDLTILSEVWEKKENTKHQAKIEELLEIKDTKYFSTARPGNKRGGGAAITARGNKFFISKLNIEIPKPLEIVWALLRPKTIIGGVSKIIICSFYSTPKSRKKSALIDHMAITINKPKVTHP